jgi:hypothetical protein
VLSSHNLQKCNGCPVTTCHLAVYLPVPTKESVDKPIRRRIRLWLIAKMREMNYTPADVVRQTGIDKGALSKFLAEGGELTLGLDNFIRLTRGLVMNANEVLHKPAPGEGSLTGRRA